MSRTRFLALFQAFGSRGLAFHETGLSSITIASITTRAATLNSSPSSFSGASSWSEGAFSRRSFASYASSSSTSSSSSKPTSSKKRKVYQPIPEEQLTRVCIIGRPNVGKSTLFNRLVGKRDALVYDTPAGHVTRDYQERRAYLMDLEFRLVDTSGMEPFAEEGSIQDRLLIQTERVVLHSDIVLFLMDAKSGLMPGDQDLAKWLRGVFPESHTVLVANKCDLGGLLAETRAQAACAEGCRLGYGEPVPISSLSGDGLTDLYARLQHLVDRIGAARAAGTHQLPAGPAPADGDIHSERTTIGGGMQATRLSALEQSAAASTPGAYPYTSDPVETGLTATPWTEREVAALERAAEREGEGRTDDLLSPHLPPLRVAIVGLPNVGKSTLLNSMLGRDRVLTGPEPGLTRDVIVESMEYEGSPVLVKDTPGVIKQRNYERHDTEGGAVTQLSQRAREKAVCLSDVAVLVVDASRMTKANRLVDDILLSERELDLATQIMDEGRALVIAANKLDSLAKGEATEVMAKLAQHIAGSGRGLQGTPLVGLSALEGRGVTELMPCVWAAYLRWNKKLNAARLNRWLSRAKTAAVGTGRANVLHRVRFLAQLKARPPTFLAFCNGSLPAREEQLTGLANALRRDFGLEGVPIRIVPRYGQSRPKAERVAALNKVYQAVSRPLDQARLGEMSPNERRQVVRTRAADVRRVGDKLNRLKAKRG